ncbi:MAG: hypothetical protein HGA85_02760 [Nanoarchaeota archaeon]|nr:hypothetical protein [Nanoarchaeota archaeon]
MPMRIKRAKTKKELPSYFSAKKDWTAVVLLIAVSVIVAFYMKASDNIQKCLYKDSFGMELCYLQELDCGKINDSVIAEICGWSEITRSIQNFTGFDPPVSIKECTSYSGSTKNLCKQIHLMIEADYDPRNCAQIPGFNDRCLMLFSMTYNPAIIEDTESTRIDRYCRLMESSEWKSLCYFRYAYGIAITDNRFLDEKSNISCEMTGNIKRLCYHTSSRIMNILEPEKCDAIPVESRYTCFEAIGSNLVNAEGYETAVAKCNTGRYENSCQTGIINLLISDDSMNLTQKKDICRGMDSSMADRCLKALG